MVPLTCVFLFMIYWEQSISIHSLSERNFEGSWYECPCILRFLNCASLTYFFVRLLFFLLLYIIFRYGHFTFTAIVLNTNNFFKYPSQFLPICRSQLLASIIRSLNLVADGTQKKWHATFCNILEHCTIICTDLTFWHRNFTFKF
jgi:hypothetical protein